MPFVRPAGGGRNRETPFVPTSSSGHGAQERSRDETALRRALQRASLDGFEHRLARALSNQRTTATKWGIFSRHFWGDFNRHLTLGFRQFLLRGLDKVRGEWSLVTMAWNLKRMFTLCSAH
jgi:Transposase DDE domain